MTFRCGNILHQDLEAARYDLIVTHFFLDVLTEPELKSLVERISHAAVPRAYWLISEFQICRDPAWARYASHVCIAVMYGFFRLTAGLKVSRIPDYRSAFTAAGMQLRANVPSLGGFLTSELWRLP